jgi:phosphoribosylformylglycinamidine synthase
MVQTQTVVLPGDGDAAVLHLRGTRKAIALTTDCNPRYCFLDPYAGAQYAVAEAARNLACVGATPLAVTDCLNFANPEKPDRFWQFRRAVEGLADACETMGTPVISGNVSFYNETPEHAIYPTPTIGMIGLIGDYNKRCRMSFVGEGDEILLVEGPAPTLGASEYLYVFHGKEIGHPPVLDLAAEKSAQALVRQAIESGLVRSAHDLSEGGLGVALAECCLCGKIGARVFSLPKGADALTTVFGERCASFVLSAKPDGAARITALAAEAGVAVHRLGTVGGDRLTIGSYVNVPVDALLTAYEDAIALAIGDEAQEV